MKRFWTKKRIKELVKKYNISSRVELKNFKKDGICGMSAYNSAIKLNIAEELFGPPLNNYWTKEKCAELALKCKTRSEFIAKYNKAYAAAKYHGWYDEITKHMPIWEDLELNEKQRYRYLIYVYEEEVTHSAYVGLTNNIERRDKEHRNPIPSKQDSLFKFCKENNVNIPKPKVLENKLCATVAGIKETEWWHKYNDAGWNMINRKASLGYYGGDIKKKWTEEKIREYLSKRPEIKSRGQFCDVKGAAYVAAYKLGILEDLFGESLNKPYTREDVIEYVKQHPEVKRRKDLRLSSAGIFNAAYKFKMLEELFGEPDIKNHTEEEIREYLKRHPEIKSRVDLEKTNRPLLRAAYKLGIVEDLFGEPLHKERTEEELFKYLKEHPEITRRIDLKTKNPSLYDFALKLNIMDELFGDSLRKERTEEELREYIKEHPEITRRDELFNSNKTMYYLAERLNLLYELFGDGREKRTKWTKETIKKYIEEHPDIKKRTDLMVKAAGAYDKAKKLKILDELFPKE